MSSKWNRRKHLEEQMDEVPELDPENQAFARVVKLHGTNIVQVETPTTSSGVTGEDGGLQECLCLLPAKFSKRFWIKRGNFVVIEFTVANDGTSEGKIRGTITHILYPDQLKRLRREGNVEWPDVFKDDDEVAGDGEDSDSCDSDGLPPLPRNPNRPKGYHHGEDESDSDSDSDS